MVKLDIRRKDSQIKNKNQSLYMICAYCSVNLK